MNIVLGVTGGIAAYKAPELVRRLQDAGAVVRVILTPNAARFVSPLALAAVSNHAVIVDQWGDASHGGVDHIDLARWSDLLLVAPATANFLAKFAVGIADDALTTYALAHRTQTAVAPAMNTYMLGHPTVTENLAKLRSRGVHVIDPDDGLLACGDEGAGRMPDVPVLVEFAKSLTRPKDLDGRSILITAGPTREALDPVRYLTNRSSGKMGYALAAAASRRGARVTLVTGPTSIALPSGVEIRRVESAGEMFTAVMEHLPAQQIVIKAAAVADYEPADYSDEKIKKDPGADELMLRLRKTPDILVEIGRRTPRPFTVAFAAETTSVRDHARTKLERKNADMIVANDVSDSAIGFDSDQNEVLVLSRDGSETRIARASKSVVADRLLDLIAERFSSTVPAA